MSPDKWFDALYQYQQQGKSYVLVTLIGAAGSTPRSTGTKMVVTGERTFDTIGGGHLEHKATILARELLAKGQQTQHIEHYPLSSKLGQCCGGANNVLFEVMVEHQTQLTIFGAGHVSKALVPVLSQLPLQIRWVDQRENMFEGVNPATNVTQEINDDPVSVISELQPGALVLIMTHNHQLDFELVELALKTPQVAFCGMIGSDTKARRFITRLQNKGMSENQIEKLVSPVGIPQVRGKKPIEVAISIAGQIVQLLNAENEQADRSYKSNTWRQSVQLSKVL